MERPRAVKAEYGGISPVERVQRWLLSSSGEFQDGLRGIITKSHAKLLQKGGHNGLRIPSYLFDLNAREPHEMPVCAFWTTWATRRPIPLGFAIVKGSVLVLDRDFIDDERQARRVDHIYLEDRVSGMVVDHCPGQFVHRRRTDIPKGERWSTLIDRAPELFTMIPVQDGGLKLLIGNKAVIEAKLGLKYDTKPQSEA